MSPEAPTLRLRRRIVPLARHLWWVVIGFAWMISLGLSGARAIAATVLSAILTLGVAFRLFQQWRDR